MAGDACLARLFREYGDRWEIERVERGTEWVACRRDSEFIDIIGGVTTTPRMTGIVASGLCRLRRRVDGWDKSAYLVLE